MPRLSSARAGSQSSESLVETRVSGPHFLPVSLRAKMSPLPLRKDCQTTVTLPDLSEAARTLKSLKGAVVRRSGLDGAPDAGISEAKRSKFPFDWPDQTASAPLPRATTAGA